MKSEAEQYFFTPRSLIGAIVEVMRPKPGMTIHDPACGTSGCLLTAHDYVPTHYSLDRDQKWFLRDRALSGVDIVDRLPTGIFYAQGDKANVLFFERKPASETLWTKKLWIYDLRTNTHFTLKQNVLTLSALEDFIRSYNAENLQERTETERFRAFDYEELVHRDKANLDIFWLRDESLDDSQSLQPPDVIAAEIVENLKAALEQFGEIYEELNGTDADSPTAHPLRRPH